MAHNMDYFINQVRVAVAIAVLQMQISLKKRGQVYSISELCDILKQSRVNWRSKCIDLEKQVQCLQTQICTSKDLGDLQQTKGQDEIFLQTSAENKFAYTFFTLRTLQFSDALSTSQEDVAERVIVGLKLLEDALENPHWPEPLLKMCAQILGKAYCYLDVNDFEVAYVYTRLNQFVTQILNKISECKDLNQQSRLNRLGITLSSLISVSNLPLQETTLSDVLQQTEDKIKSFVTNRNSWDFENIYYFLDIAESIMKEVTNSKMPNISSLFIKLFDRIHKIYELSSDFPLISYRVWQLLEIIRSVIDDLK